MKKLIFALTFVLASGLAASAQATDPAQAQQPRDCQAQPDSKTAQGQGAEPRKPRSDDLSGSLQPCGGVLTPPPTGDDNAATPPANGSEMPVIKPGQVRPQTSK